MAGTAFTDLGWNLRVVNCWEHAAPPSGLGGDALLVLGGPMNVDETARYPFLAWETDWIRDWALAGRPMLGICLGAQLLAKALGGVVTRNRAPEIGHFTVALTREGRMDPLFSGFPREIQVVQWHSDTFSIPSGSTRLAGSALCDNQALRFRHAIGLQFHLEIGRAKMAAWVNEYAADAAQTGVNVTRLLLDFREREANYARNCRLLVENFDRFECAEV
jgi:GMP synthase-like glutamine amidotransferase